MAPAPEARALLTIGALSSMFAGLLGAREAIRLGVLRDADADTAANLDAALHRGIPWTFDWF
jgi:hypothetical protein